MNKTKSPLVREMALADRKGIRQAVEALNKRDKSRVAFAIAIIVEGENARISILDTDVHDGNPTRLTREFLPSSGRVRAVIEDVFGRGLIPRDSLIFVNRECKDDPTKREWALADKHGNPRGGMHTFSVSYQRA
jgi:hypothetical protein